MRYRPTSFRRPKASASQSLNGHGRSNEKNSTQNASAQQIIGCTSAWAAREGGDRPGGHVLRQRRDAHQEPHGLRLAVDPALADPHDKVCGQVIKIAR